MRALTRLSHRGLAHGAYAHAEPSPDGLSHGRHNDRQHRAWWSCGVILGAGIIGLGLERLLSFGWQPVLGLCAWIIFLGLLWVSDSIERYQAVIVVVVATFFEVVGSILWGAYVYRHHNLPSFVPPGHGMVYLFGLRFTQTNLVRHHRQALIRIATVGVLGWAVLGLVALGRVDVAGAIGAVILTLFMIRSRSGVVYAGVFVYVAFLEIYGTWLGTWYWLPHVPGIGVPNGNPPSGIAGGYVFFDMAALALTPFAIAVVAGFRAKRRRTPLRAAAAQRPSG